MNMGIPERTALEPPRAFILGTNARVVVVTVTFDPQQSLLLQQLECVLPQVSRVLLVDNGSSEATLNWMRPLLAKFAGRVELLELGTNTGVGHAQNRGIDAARADGADAVLLLDHDSVPGTDMVAHLISGRSGRRRPQGRNSWARCSRLDSFQRAAATLKTHFDAVMRGMLDNRPKAFVEPTNGLMQQAKRAARGFRTITNFINIAYLRPSKPTHLPASPFAPTAPLMADATIHRL